MPDEVALGFSDGAPEVLVVELGGDVDDVRAGVVTGMPLWWVVSSSAEERCVRMPRWARLPAS